MCDKIKLIFISILSIYFFSCKKELINDRIFIENLSNDEKFDLPLYNESLLIFINKENIIYKVSLRELYNIKEKKYKEYKNFDLFLIKTLNENLLTKEDLTTNLIDNFKLNSSLVNELNKDGLASFKKKYCESSNSKNKFYLKNDLDLEIKNNLMYLFFKNNYYVMQNDHSGKYVLIDKNK